MDRLDDVAQAASPFTDSTREKVQETTKQNGVFPGKNSIIQGFEVLASCIWMNLEGVSSLPIPYSPVTNLPIFPAQKNFG
jgi:hypothetical protein